MKSFPSKTCRAVLFVLICLSGIISCNRKSAQQRAEFTRANSTAFFTAVKQDDEAAVKELLTRGFNVNLQDEYGFTGLMYAVQSGYTQLSRRLISAKPEIDLPNKKGATALMIACDARQKELAELLIKQGADLDAQTLNGVTALMIATLAGYDEIIDLLLAEKPTLKKLISVE